MKVKDKVLVDPGAQELQLIAGKNIDNKHCAAKLAHKVKINRSFLYFTSSAVSLC
jgi:hypothetical protein